MHPLYRLTHKGATWDWGEEVFKAKKQVMKTVQALRVIDQSQVCDSDIRITPKGYTWVLWQWQGCKVPTGFWPQLQKGADAWYSPIAQVNAVYQALLPTEAITGLPLKRKYKEKYLCKISLQI